MKVSELMINDLVLYREVPHKIHLMNFVNQADKNVFNDFNPIPLTAEILEKNGFEKTWLIDCDTAYIVNDDFYISFYPTYTAMVMEINDNDCLDDYVVCVVNYVHELQHALRLVGLTDLADNLKI